jgi:hypothetical protein
MWSEALKAQLLANFGPTASQFRLGGDPTRTDLPSSLEVWMWHPDSHSDLTTLATCGICDQTLPNKADPKNPLQNLEGSGERVELHWAWMGKVDPELEVQRVQWLAQMALVPWMGADPFAWGQVLSLAGDIPGFPGCNGILLHPPFTDDGWAFAEGPQSEVHANSARIRILNVVPLRNDERLLASEHGLRPLFERWEREDRNPFKPL